MRKRTETPVRDRESYPFVSVQTLRNTFPENGPADQPSSGRSVRGSEPDTDFTGVAFTKALKRVNRKISEPAAKRSGTSESIVASVISGILIKVAFQVLCADGMT